jgi:hypothetical protein
MKAKNQRKISRAIVTQKAQKRNEVFRITDCQGKVEEKYDYKKRFKTTIRMGEIWGRQ